MVGKIGDFAELTSPADGDLFEVVDVSDTTDDASGSTRRIAWSTFKAAFVEVSGDTMTGVLAIQATGARLELRQAGGTEVYAIYKLSDGDDRFRMRDQVNGVLFFEYDPADESIDMTASSSVSVPDATADGEALAYGQADAELAGLTATGAVDVEFSSPYLRIRDTNAASVPDKRDFRLKTFRDDFRIQLYDDAGGFVGTLFQIDATGRIRLDADPTSTVTVPDATADTHALNRQTADARYGDRLWLGAADLNITDGSPVLDAVFASRNVGWKMSDTGGLQLVAGSVVIPAGWSSYDVNVWWYTSATTGDVVLRRRVFGKAPGDAGGTGAGNVDTTATVAGVANEITSTTVASGNTQGVGGSAIAFLEVGRFADDAADTATSTVSVLGVELVRVS